MFIKTIVGWMFGFNKEISQMKKELGQLGVDKAWGLHTKSVLSLVNGSNGDAEKTVALLSFEGLAERKKEFGSVEIDNRVKTIFRQPLRTSDIAARWNENEVIMVLSSNNGGAEIPLKRLASIAEEQGITFSYVMKEWQPGRNSLAEVAKELNKIINKKGD